MNLVRKRISRRFLGCAGFLLAAASQPAAAALFGSLGQLDQNEFERLVSNLGASTQYKAVSPGESLGTLGADIGIELASTDMDTGLFEKADDGSTDLDALLIPRLHVQKGLPFGIDVGAFVGTLIDTDVTVVGAEIRFALLEGGVLSPSLALRGSYSRMQGEPELELDNIGAEVVLSKGVLNFTPYIGAGVVRTESRARYTPSLEDVSVNQEKIFAGLNVNLGLNVAIEFDRTGDYDTWSAKAGIRF